jgi:hypothetical protein
MDADSRRWKKRMVEKTTPRYPAVNPFFSIHVHLCPFDSGLVLKVFVHLAVLGCGSYFLLLPGFRRKRLVGGSMLQTGCGGK